jgi:hypothetical protein
MKFLLRYYHTIKYLKLKQIRFQLYYRLRAKVRSLFHIKQTLSITNKSYPVKLIPWIEKANSLSDFSFNFLNLNKSFNPSEIDWEYNKYGKLWKYNLNYFDFLLQPEISSKTCEFLINDFINKLSQKSISLEPYPISLRGISWIKFISKFKIQNSKIDNSLFAQYKILLKNLEYHLLGNHLLENGFALLFGAFYFNDQKFYYKAKEVIEKQLEEQILSDGGHFELSTMYHQIILDRLLDSINLLQNNLRFDNQDFLLCFLKEKASAMLSWLKQMTFSNGDIPHFNDSTNSIAPISEQLFNYAQKLNLQYKTVQLKLSTSGYRRFNGKFFEYIVDVGPVGPDYIPGHAHADMLSFVLYVDNKPIIIDTGISTYEKNNQRQLERSTSSHNTVVVDGKNQSDVWGGFKVGKRAGIKIVKDNSSELEAFHNGYCPVLHFRNFKFNDNGFLIEDRLSKSENSGKALLHFHPDRIIKLLGTTIQIDNKQTIDIINSNRITIEPYYFPIGFNKLLKSYVTIIQFKGSVAMKFNL